jgi:hypothetical protein
VTDDDAADALHGEELVPALQGSLDDIKRMRDECLGADIPVALMAPPGKG